MIHTIDILKSASDALFAIGMGRVKHLRILRMPLVDWETGWTIYWDCRLDGMLLSGRVHVEEYSRLGGLSPTWLVIEDIVWKVLLAHRRAQLCLHRRRCMREPEEEGFDTMCGPDDCAGYEERDERGE